VHGGIYMYGGLIPEPDAEQINLVVKRSQNMVQFLVLPCVIVSKSLRHVSDGGDAMRTTERYEVEHTNSLWQIYNTVTCWKLVENFIVIQLGRYSPFLSVKNWLYRFFLRMKVGDKTSFALTVMPDIMFPEKITVGDNSIIGYNTTILAHEYLIDEYRIGERSEE